MSAAESERPRYERRQQHAEELCAATIRALSGRARIRYRGHRLELDGRILPIRAPHLRVNVDEDDFISFRGVADGVALRLAHSDFELHGKLMPDTAVEQTVFEVLEQLRVESLVGDQHPGMKRNLEHRFRQWCGSFHASGMADNQIGLLIYTVIQIAWSRLTGNPTEESTEGLIEAQRAELAPVIGTFLAGLRKDRNDQAAYATHALGIAAVLAGIVEVIGRARGESVVEIDSNVDDGRAGFKLLLDADDDLAELPAVGESPIVRSDRQLAEQLASYRIYDNSHDRIVEASTLVREPLLREYRQRLDQRIRRQGINIPRLSRNLARMLGSPRRSGWAFAQEEGYLHAGRIVKIVTTPGDHRIFRQERIERNSDCQVTFLVDNSGSMKQHIESIAMLVDVFGRALESAGARSEILGFTTNTWNGGKPHKDWLSRGRPRNPGRLNETCHLIYKDAESLWRRSRAGIAAMLQASQFREGADGEALQWAAQRLRASQSRRKILIVICDGCPMDGATRRTNPPDYLDQHLRHVAALIERGREIELYALGVGLDLSNYYENSLALDLSRSFDNAVFDEILNLIARSQRR